MTMDDIEIINIIVFHHLYFVGIKIPHTHTHTVCFIIIIIVTFTFSTPRTTNTILITVLINTVPIIP